jgi:hypothetical protein
VLILAGQFAEPDKERLYKARRLTGREPPRPQPIHHRVLQLEVRGHPTAGDANLVEVALRLRNLQFPKRPEWAFDRCVRESIRIGPLPNSIQGNVIILHPLRWHDLHAYEIDGHAHQKTHHDLVIPKQ